MTASSDPRATDAEPPADEAPRTGADLGAAPARKPPRLAKRVRRRLAARLIGLAAIVLPRLYLAYMWLVRVTSKEDGQSLDDVLFGAVHRHDRAVAALWHEEVFTVAYNYRHFHGHTLASVSDFGEVISEMLRLCNFVVFRGGSGSKSRRRDVLGDLIEHMETTPRVIYGLTVDGSQGPVYRLKPGAVAIAKACRAPIVLVRTHYARGITLRTWDRTQIPLPFNRRLTLASGPYWIAPDADDATAEAFRRHLESELLELTARVAVELDGDPGPYWGFPPGWTTRWTPGRLGTPHGPHDLRPENPPPWANRKP
ncbi:MAG: hypothetical protein IT293_08160 [Deltaproteobacteria bacterium]|nr:hypothetical protein [Deltaproteobacteria bacterium]